MKKGVFRTNSCAPKKLAMFLRLMILSFVFAVTAFAQTSAFTFQGKLNNGGVPANTNFDMRFALFDAAGTGNQVGSTLTLTNVGTVGGIFTVQLDFGADAFTGADRFVEISISPAGQNNFVTLAPRQRLTSAPYSVQSLKAATADTSDNSLNLGGIAASGYVQTSDARLTDARVPLPGSTDYVQNNPNAPQGGVNFSIGGTGSANILNAVTQFNLGGQRFISAAANGNLFVGAGTGANTTGDRNTFVGLNAGAANTFGSSNSFFGDAAGIQNTGQLNSFFGVDAGRNNAGTQNSFFGGFVGYANTDGSLNSFFGYSAGFNNTAGSENSFFGNSSGITNTTGNANSFFGFESGRQNGTGSNNSFFGSRAGGNNFSGASNSFVGGFAGRLNTTGNSNSFVGASAGFNNTTGNFNLFFGASAGIINSTGSNNTILGANANLGANNLNNAAAIGFGALVTQSNSLILGGITGFNGGTDTNVGIGTTSPLAKLHIARIEEGIRLQGKAVNNNNLAYMSFVDGAGNQMGYVGDGGFNDRGIFLTATGDDVALITPAGRVLTASFAGNVLMRGGANVLGATADFYAAQTIDTGNFKGLFTPNLFLSGLDTFAPSAMHICARLQTIGGSGGYALTRCTTALASAEAKTDFQPFSGGLSIIRRLNPTVFKWKADGTTGVGLNAEEVAEVAPQLVTRNERGEVEDVRENSLNLVFINAIKEQQKQIEAQAEQIKKQQSQIDALKKLVCRSDPQAEGCRE